MSMSFHHILGGIIRISGRISMKRPGDHSDKSPYPSDPPNPQFRYKVLETFGATRSYPNRLRRGYEETI